MAASQHARHPGVSRHLGVRHSGVWNSKHVSSGVFGLLDDGLQRRPYRARRGICARHSRCRRARAGRVHDVRRQGLHGDGSRLGAQARRLEPDGRIGRASALCVGQYQDRGGTCRTAGAAGASAGGAAGRRSHCRRACRGRRHFQRHPAVRTHQALAHHCELHHRDCRRIGRDDRGSGFCAGFAS